jgi:hypothetical protein
MDTVGSLGAYLNPILAFLQKGFDQVNAVQGLLIALFATVLMARWAQLFAIALGASLVNIAADTIVPIVTRHADIKLPPIMHPSFWNYAASLYVGFVIIVAMFFAVKSVVFKPSAKKPKAHRAQS